MHVSLFDQYLLELEASVQRAGGQVHWARDAQEANALIAQIIEGHGAREVIKVKSLPYASSLCGACYEVCPVKINTPQVLISLRGQVVRQKQRSGLLRDRADPKQLVMRWMARTFVSRARYERAQRLARLGQWPFKHGEVIEKLPGELGGWTLMRDLPAVPAQSFREWWRARSASQATASKEELA